jgi:hypothetical protein
MFMNAMLSFQEIQTGCTISNFQSKKKLLKQVGTVLVASYMSVKESHRPQSHQPHKLLNERAPFEDCGSTCLTKAELDYLIVGVNSFCRHDESIQPLLQAKTKGAWNLAIFPIRKSMGVQIE